MPVNSMVAYAQAFLLDIWKGKRKSYDCSYKKKRDIFFYSFEIRLLLLGGMRKKISIIGQVVAKKILGFAKNSRVVFWHKNQNNHVHNSIDVAIFQKRNVNSKMKSVRNCSTTVISPTPSSQKHSIWRQHMYLANNSLLLPLKIWTLNCCVVVPKSEKNV